MKFNLKIKDKVITREGSTFEFKESFNWGSKSEYAKTIAAYANNKGGMVIFGIKNKPREVVGLKNNSYYEIDEAKIAEYLNSTFSPEIKFEKLIHQIRGKPIGILSIEQSSNKPAICIKNDGVLKEGEIYYRYNARSEKIKYPELHNIMEGIKDLERKNWMSLIERISKIGPTNSAILNINNGQIIGQKGTLLIDKKLLGKIKFVREGSFKNKGWPTLKLVGNVMPISFKGYESKLNDKGVVSVQVTSDENAQSVRLEEADIFEYYKLDYKQLIKILKTRYKNFIIGPRFHKLKALLWKNSEFCNLRRLNPQNPRSSSQIFYSKKIINEFDKHYIKK